MVFPCRKGVIYYDGLKKEGEVPTGACNIRRRRRRRTTAMGQGPRQQMATSLTNQKDGWRSGHRPSSPEKREKGRITTQPMLVGLARELKRPSYLKLQFP